VRFWFDLVVGLEVNMLTNAQVREAKPRTIRYEITCESLPGFILRVLPTGKKVFFARYRDVDGKDHRHRLGLVGPGFGVDEARREAMAILARREAPTSAGEPNPAARTAATAPISVPKSLTIREFALRFEQEHIDMFLKPETASHFRGSLRRYILPALGERPLDQVTTLEVQQFVNKLKPKPCAANYARCVLSCLFTKAIKWLPELQGRANPVKDVTRFAERAVERFLSPDEREALESVLRTAERTPPGRQGHIGREGVWAIRLLALTGMRRDEIRDLRWEHVQWRQKVLRLPDSKTGKREVVASDEVMALLGKIGQVKGHPQRGLVVCSKNGRKLHSLGATWRRVRLLAGLPDDTRIHDLRHSLASDAIMDGVPLEVVGKMLGHKNYRTTQRYSHIADTALREAVNRTARTIIRAGQGRKGRTRSKSR
jgi:integrase